MNRAVNWTMNLAMNLAAANYRCELPP